MCFPYVIINNAFSGEGTSSPVGFSVPGNEHNEEFQILLVKEEESEDEASISTATVCGNTANLTLTEDHVTAYKKKCDTRSILNIISTPHTLGLCSCNQLVIYMSCLLHS